MIKSNISLIWLIVILTIASLLLIYFVKSHLREKKNKDSMEQDYWEKLKSNSYEVRGFVAVTAIIVFTIIQIYYKLFP